MKKYDYVIAPPIIPAIVDKPQIKSENNSNFGTQTFSVGCLE
jgi:hypothetical protein